MRLRNCFNLLFIFLTMVSITSSYAADNWVRQFKLFDGNRRWRFTHIDTTRDGGYIAAGNIENEYIGGEVGQYKTDPWLVKFDASGSIEWQKSYDDRSTGIPYLKINSVEQDPDGGYIIAGASNVAETPDDAADSLTRAWIFKLKPNGDIQWRKFIYGYRPSKDGFFHSSEEALCARVLSDGYILGATSSSFSRKTGSGTVQDAWLVRLNRAGDVLWTRSYNHGDEYTWLTWVEPISTGFMISGYTEAGGWIMEVDAEGIPRWEQVYNLPVRDVDNNLAFWKIRAGLAGYVVAGSIRSNANQEGFLMRIKTNGEVIWQRSYRVDEQSTFWDVQNVQVLEGDVVNTRYVVSGDTWSRFARVKGWLLTIDTNGDVVWDKQYYPDPNFHLNFRSVIAHDSESSGQTYIVAGSKWSKDADYVEFALLTSQSADPNSGRQCATNPTVAQTSWEIQPQCANVGYGSPYYLVDPFPVGPHIQDYDETSICPPDVDFQLPDLTARWRRASRFGDSIYGEVNVINTGRIPSGGFTAEVFLSKDDQLSMDDVSIVAFGNPGLLAGGADGPIPINYDSPGSRDYTHLIIFVDRDRSVTEFDESDNVVSIKIQDGWYNSYVPVLPPTAVPQINNPPNATLPSLCPPQHQPGADLQVSWSGTQWAGSTLLLNARVSNPGESASGPFSVRVYLSEDATPDPTDTVIDTQATGSLNPGESRELQFVSEAPSSDQMRTWIAYTDIEDTVAEAIETNNAAAWINPYVPPPPYSYTPPPPVVTEGDFYSPYWHPVSEAAPDFIAEQGIHDFAQFTLDDVQLQSQTGIAPYESTNPYGYVWRPEITVPLPNGRFARFRIEQTPLFDSQTTYSDPYLNSLQYQSYTGYGVDDPSAVLRLSHSVLGWNAVLLREDGNFRVRPAVPGSNGIYVSYKIPKDGSSTDVQRLLSPEAMPGEGPAAPPGDPTALPMCPDNHRISRPNCRVEGYYSSAGTQAFRQREARFGRNAVLFRMIPVLTREFVALYGDDRLFAGAMVLWGLDNVIPVYRRDLNIRITVVGFYFYDSITAESGWLSNELTDEARTAVDAVYPGHHYDSIFVVTTFGAGVDPACIIGTYNLTDMPDRCTCRHASGGGIMVPSAARLLSDRVWQGVAHTLGYSLWATEVTGVCLAIDPEDDYEVGAGTTLMGMQLFDTRCEDTSETNSYFHVASLERVHKHLAEQTCMVSWDTGVEPPTVTTDGLVFVPRNTPFRLTASATAAPGHTPTFTWEQFDQAEATFRSRPPSLNPTRTFPALETVVGGPRSFEALSVFDTRQSFRVTARDGQGGTAYQTAEVVVRGEPLVVVSPAAGEKVSSCKPFTVHWTGGKLTWFMNIKLSTDGGKTFFTIAWNVPNTGFASVQMPSMIADGIIMVESSTGSFFQVSSPFSLTNTKPKITFVSSVSVNKGGAASVKVATVSDPDQPASELNVSAYLQPTYCDVCYPNIQIFAFNSGGNVFLNADAACNVDPGMYAARVWVSDCSGWNDVVDVPIEVKPAMLPRAPQYQPDYFVSTVGWLWVQPMALSDDNGQPALLSYQIVSMPVGATPPIIWDLLNILNESLVVFPLTNTTKGRYVFEVTATSHCDATRKSVSRFNVTVN